MMREETTLAKAVRIGENKVAYDTACKCILAQKRILAWINEVDMVGSAQEPQENYDLMTLVIVRLGNAEESNNRTLQMLDVLFSRREDQQEKRKILEKEFDLPMTQELERAERMKPELICRYTGLSREEVDRIPEKVN